MQDMNIRLLLHRIWETWKSSGYARARPKSYVFMSALDPVQQAVLNRWGIKLLSGSSADQAEGLRNFLERLRDEVQRVDLDARLEATDTSEEIK